MSVTPSTGPLPASPSRLPGTFWLALPLFGALLWLGLRAHELWRDETQAWAVARDSGSLFQLLATGIRYEGHPPLWYAMLYPLTRLTHDPVAMQVLHGLLAVACAVLILARAPFPRPIRVLLLFGYFPLYEWGVLSRNYAVGLLALLVALALYPRRRERLVPLAVALALMANANAYAMFVAAAFAGALLWATWRDRRAGQPWPGTPPQRFGAALVLAAGFGVAMAYLIPPHDRWSGHATTLYLRSLVGGLAAIWNGWVPLPQPGNYSFWNTNIVTLASWNGTILLRALLGLTLVGTAAWLLRRQGPALVFLLLGTATIYLFTALRWPGYLRHHGHFFLLFVGAAWLAVAEGRAPLGRGVLRLLLGLALAHVVAGGFALAMDLKYPFSDSRATARFIRAGRLNGLPIVGTRDCIVSPLATYLDRDLYYPEYGGWGSAWMARYRERYYDPIFALNAARTMAEERRDTVLLILSKPMPPGQAGADIRPLANFNSSLLCYDSGFSRLEPEHFYLYEILPPPERRVAD